MTATLNGWKQIAAYLRQTVKTAKSWEQEGMPVHRAGKGENVLVFAFPAELVQWSRMNGGNGGNGEARSMLAHADLQALKRNRELCLLLRKEISRARRRAAAIRKSLAITTQRATRAPGGLMR